MYYDVTTTLASDQMDEEKCGFDKEQKETLVSVSASVSSGSSSLQGNKGSVEEDDDERKSSVHLQNHHARKKVKVDWTPELHGQFVKAVERLGLDKAVPSKILELMGTDCLTRHNVASHLQKYRTHQKNLMAREAEVATLRQRRRVYGTTGSAAAKRDGNSWGVPTTGFPPVKPMPWHVWGFPSSVSQSWSYTWPDHRTYLPQPPPVWAPHHSSWYGYQQEVMAPGVPCFPHCPSPMFASAGIGIPVVPPDKTLPQAPLDPYLQSNESMDPVIGDVLSKPWLPMPLGLKPPSIDSILVELQRQGISKIPTTCAM